MNKKFLTGKDLEKRVKNRMAKRKQRAKAKREAALQRMYPGECVPMTAEIAKSPEKLSAWIAPRVNQLETSLCLESDTRQKGVQKHVDQLIKLIEVNQKSEKPDDRLIIQIAPMPDDVVDYSDLANPEDDDFDDDDADENEA